MDLATKLWFRQSSVQFELRWNSDGDVSERKFILLAFMAQGWIFFQKCHHQKSIWTQIGLNFVRITAWRQGPFLEKLSHNAGRKSSIWSLLYEIYQVLPNYFLLQKPKMKMELLRPVLWDNFRENGPCHQTVIRTKFSPIWAQMVFWWWRVQKKIQPWVMKVKRP